MKAVIAYAHKLLRIIYNVLSLSTHPLIKPMTKQKL